MDMTKDTSPTHRVGLTENEILALVEELTDMKTSVGLTFLLRNAFVKLSNKYNSIDNGTVRADYVPNGRKRESKINLSSLGADEGNGVGKYNNPSDMSDAINDQLTWMVNHPEVPQSEMPPVEEFMKGGKYHEELEQFVEGALVVNGRRAEDSVGITAVVDGTDSISRDAEAAAFFSKFAE